MHTKKQIAAFLAARGTDADRPSLCGIGLNYRGDGCDTMLATDGHRMHLLTVDARTLPSWDSGAPIHPGDILWLQSYASGDIARTRKLPPASPWDSSSRWQTADRGCVARHYEQVIPKYHDVGFTCDASDIKAILTRKFDSLRAARKLKVQDIEGNKEVAGWIVEDAVKVDDTTWIMKHRSKWLRICRQGADDAPSYYAQSYGTRGKAEGNCGGIAFVMIHRSADGTWSIGGAQILDASDKHYSGNMEVTVNAALLLDAINGCDGATTIMIDGTLEPVTVECDFFKAVVMPVRV